MGRFGTALAAAGLGGVLYAKYRLYKKVRGGGQKKRDFGRVNRRSFGSMPRSQQRSVLYYRRSQLRDMETIYRRGYKPRSTSTRHRKFF